jgi:hypothetical protein
MLSSSFEECHYAVSFQMRDNNISWRIMYSRFFLRVVVADMTDVFHIIVVVVVVVVVSDSSKIYQDAGFHSY